VHQIYKFDVRLYNYYSIISY